MLLANAGTPMIWGAFCQLSMGNVVIAYLESQVLSWAFGVPRKRAFSRMLLANVVSCVVGYGLLLIARGWLLSALVPEPRLFEVPRIVVVLWVTLFIITVLLEWPFCHSLLRSPARSLHRSLVASAVAQAISYSLLVPYYWFLSTNSLYREARLETDLGFVKHPNAVIFYIEPESGDVWRINADGTDRRFVADANLTSSSHWLFAYESSISRRLDLCSAWNTRYSHAGETALIVEAFWPAPSDERLMGRLNEKHYATTSVDLAGWVSEENGTSVRTSIWAEGGLYVATPGGETVHLAFATPLVWWFCRNATVLPGDQIIFQLGDQIVILDIRTRQLGFITLGRGPLVMMNWDQVPSAPTQAQPGR